MTSKTNRRGFLRSLVTASASIAASAPLALTPLPATAAPEGNTSPASNEDSRECWTLGSAPQSSPVSVTKRLRIWKPQGLGS